jgi:hypothetical protein
MLLRADRVLAGVALAAGTVLSLLYTRSFPDPPGVTGYYYLKQIEVLADEGRFFFEDHSLAFLLPAALTWITNSLDAYRLAIALTWSTLVVGVMSLGVSLAGRFGAREGDRASMALITLLATAACVTLHELALNYYKNLFGVTLLVWAAVAASGARRWGRVVAPLLSLLALLTHKSAFLLVGGLLAAWAVDGLRTWTWRRVAVLVAGGAALTALFLLVFARARHYLLALAGGFDSPAGWTHWLGQIARRDTAVLVVYLCGVAALLLYVVSRRRVRGDRPDSAPVSARLSLDAMALFLLVSLHPFQRAGPHEASYRMIVLSPAFIVPLVLLCGQLSRARLAACTAVLLAMVVQPALEPGRAAGHFPTWSRLDGQIEAIRAHVRPGDYLISHHGMESYIGYRTGIRSKQYLPAPGARHRRVFRVAYLPEGRPGGEARDELNMVKLAQIGPDYALLLEEDWQEISRRFNIRPHWRNPNEHRPAHVHQ